MRCPVCHNVTLLHESLEANLSTSRCPQCLGHFIRGEHYHRWREQRGDELVNTSVADDNDLTVVQHQKAKLCPHCGGFLIRYPVGSGLNFHLDHCGRCGGIWFDEHEWTILKRRNLHDDVHIIFTTAWQAQVRAEARRTYEQHILARHREQLADMITREDLQRLDEVRRWLQSHPQRDRLLGYLMLGANTQQPTH